MITPEDMNAVIAYFIGALMWIYFFVSVIIIPVFKNKPQGDVLGSE